jgi:type III secretory pathway component EscS
MEVSVRDENIERLRQKRLNILVLIIIVASLVWGLVGSVDLFIVSLLQHIFPTKTKLQYSFIQIFVYIVLICIVIYLTDVDVSNLFMASNHFKLSETVSSRG